MIGYLKELKYCIDILISKDKLLKKISKMLMESDNVFVCGNGGSSATASHFVNDLQKMCGIKAYCLSDNTPLVTAYGNDEGYDTIFQKQLEVLGSKNDTLVVISGSGSSPNIIESITAATKIGMNTIAFIGMDGGMIKKYKLTDKIIHITTDMLHAEDCHLIICHCIADYIKNTVIK